VAVGLAGPAQATRCPAPCRPALPLILIAIVIVILMMFLSRSNHDHDHSGHSRTNGQQRLGLGVAAIMKSKSLLKGDPGVEEGDLDA
jgi:hypothetical protein